MSFLFSFFFLLAGTCQITFVSPSSEVLPKNIYGGFATAIVDIDNDTHDDLICISDGKLKVLCYRGNRVAYEEVFTVNI